MRTTRALVASLLCICLSCAVGCSGFDRDAEFSETREIAKLASLECYYHNVVKYNHASDGYLFNLIDNQRNYWFEYDGIVKMGFNADKVSISKPDADGVVTITIPEVEILGHPDIDTDSMTDPIEVNGWSLFNHVSADEKNKAITDAQSNLIQTAENDISSKAQATQRGKELLEQYVKNVGMAIGRTYTIQWQEVESD